MLLDGDPSTSATDQWFCGIYSEPYRWPKSHMLKPTRKSQLILLNPAVKWLVAPSKLSTTLLLAAIVSQMLAMWNAVASLGGTGEARTALMTPSRGWHPNKIIFLWLNLERTLDKRRGRMGVVRWRQPKKVVIFQGAMTKKRRKFFKKK